MSVKRLTGAFVVAALVASVVAVPVTAAGGSPGDRTVALCVSPAPEMTDLKKIWDAGPTSHWRGWVATYTAVGDPLCAGTVEVVAGLDMSMGSGGIRGTVVYRLSAIDGGWIGTFEQVWAFDKGQLTSGREVARGFGALEGWQLRGVLDESIGFVITETVLVFAPGR